ncbi:restriction endonuclease [Collinsella ureilytica]|uniref:restriction endonuclease n=1 Tax=Collinsella ureilytica TaxID=2869515 RepID=UPI00352EAFB2
MVYDSSSVERTFAEALDKQDEVLVFAKLPSSFKIDTPLRSYNPDWAYVEDAGGERRVYFVTETKGGKNGEPALRDAERIKIDCAKRHFEALSLGYDFHYNVRTTYQYESAQ